MSSLFKIFVIQVSLVLGVLTATAFAEQDVVPVGARLSSDYTAGFGQITVHVPDKENLTVEMDRNVCSFTRMGYVGDCTQMTSESLTGRAVENTNLPGRGLRTVYSIQSTPYELHYSKREGFRILILEGDVVLNSIRLHLTR